MIKKILFELLLAFPLILMGQQKVVVEISGKVKYQKKGLSGATIKVYDGGNLYITKTTDKLGKFKLSLPLNKEFIIETSKKNYVTKKISFDTHVPKSEFNWTYNFTVELFGMVPGLDVSALSQPVAKVKYFKEYDDFDYDMNYFNQMKSKLDKIMAQLEVLKKQAYKNTVAQADKLFREKKYEEAISLYNKAIDYDPLSYYPDDQIQKCEKFLVETNRSQNTYDRNITEADAYFSSKNYQSALSKYQKASEIKPDEQYPKQKINETNKLIAQQKEQQKQEQKNQDYQAAITSADSYFGKKQYGIAKTYYQTASGIKPSETYPKQKISDIDKLLADQAATAAKDKQYQDAIKKADGLLASKQYNEAKSSYQTASGIKPSETYPKQKISDINKLLANQAAIAEKDKQYQDAIKKADGLLASKQYNEAKISYQTASGIKPSETYPKQKISDIDKLLADQAATAEKDKKYQDAIKKADGLLASKQYNKAKNSYQTASGIKPSETYPKQKISDIDKLLADQAATAEKDKKYQDAIKKADGLLASKQYNEAKSSYQTASGIKPSETYPKQKISDIDKLLADQAATAEKDKKYQDAIKKADGLLASKQYNKAKSSYQTASGIKPSETYPKQKISDIDKLLADQAANAEKDKQYQDAIKKADGLLVSKQYNEAKSSYQTASGIKPSETYPKQKISDIDKLLADQAATAEKDKKYQDAIKKADGLLASKQYNEAKSSYQTAGGIKPSENYPKQKISDIDKLLADQAATAEKDKKYQDAIKKADGLLASKQYNEAKSSYQTASGIKPSETYPKQKISDIDKLLADQAATAEKDKQYQDAIKKADGLMASKNYNEAKSSYQTAGGIKPSETYPKQKISDIDKLLADQAATAEKDKKYQDVIKKADGLLASKQYNEAKSSYQTASGIKPSETYPKQKISDINKLLADQAATAAKDKQYQDAIKKADGLLASKQYNEAKSSYQTAAGIKPSETYPKQKISEIDKILADQAAAAEKDKQYQDAIKKADGLLASKQYNEAKSSYQTAGSIKPSETYPRQKISEINKILADQAASAEKDKQYQDAIKKADGLLASKNYNEAKSSYQTAGGIKPDESYPKQKISEIDKLLADQAAAAEKDKQYQDAIKKADGLLASKNYNEAKSSYQTAGGIKPSETYPKQKISDIDKLLADQAAATEKDKKYQDAISKADNLFSAKQYEDAKVAFQIASGIKTGEDYPKEKIAEINKILAELASKKSKEEQYKNLISEADVLYNNKNFPLAKTKYQSASDILPDKQYPKDRIAEIDKYLTDLAKQNAASKARNELYKATITKADNYYQSKKYNDALAQYKKAADIKSNVQYPKNQISKIKKYLAQLAQNNNNANTGISKSEEEANKKLNEVNFKDKVATKKYLSALAKKYPEGKTVENYTFKNKTVNRIIIKHGSVANDYREVKHSWGGDYYFKNGQNISKTIFYQETNK